MGGLYLSSVKHTSHFGRKPWETRHSRSKPPEDGYSDGLESLTPEDGRQHAVSPTTLRAAGFRGMTCPQRPSKSWPRLCMPTNR
jgi:hypothetical protein